MSKTDDDLLVMTRKALQPVWDSCLVRGRCWGTKEVMNRENPMAGSHITFIDRHEAVDVCVYGGVLIVRHYGASTRLISLVRANLHMARIKYVEAK
jgi:hypothetical protein